MGKLITDITMSLDGFIAGPKERPDEPLGEGGLRLHDWLTTDRTDVESTMLEQSVPGAILCGRRTYDNSRPWWGVGKGPAGSTPVFVVSHTVDNDALGDDSPFTFVADGIASALDQAKAAAGGNDVCVMGGADLIQQFLKAGLVDEISIHLAPVLLGNGRKLFDTLPEHVELRPIEVVESSAITHLRYRVRKG